MSGWCEQRLRLTLDPPNTSFTVLSLQILCFNAEWHKTVVISILKRSDEDILHLGLPHRWTYRQVFHEPDVSCLQVAARLLGLRIQIPQGGMYVCLL